MSRTLLGVIVAVTLVAFLFVLAGAQLFKQPLSPDEDVAHFLRQLEPVLQEGADWQEAAKLQAQIEHAWSHVEKRIQISVEKADMIEFTEELARLKAAIEIEEQPVAWEALALLKTIWNRMR